MSKPLTSLSPTAGTLFSSSRFCSVLSSVDEVPLISEPIIHSRRQRRRHLVSRIKREYSRYTPVWGSTRFYFSGQKIFFSHRVFFGNRPYPNYGTPIIFITIIGLFVFPLSSVSPFPKPQGIVPRNTASIPDSIKVNSPPRAVNIYGSVSKAKEWGGGTQPTQRSLPSPSLNLPFHSPG